LPPSPGELRTDQVLYKARARIEQMMGKIMRFKRIVLRCEKTATNYASFLALVCGFILIKSVHNRQEMAMRFAIGYPAPRTSALPRKGACGDHA
jgi:hypothetical protein